MKKSISLFLVLLIVLSMISVPVSALPGDTYSNDFLADTDVTFPTGGNFKFIQRPADDVALSNPPAVPADGVTNRSIYSGLVDSKYAAVVFPSPITSDIVLEGQFRLEGKPIDTLTTAGLLHFFQVRINSSTYIFSLTCGTYNDNGYKLRPLYANTSGTNQTASIQVDGQDLKYKKWYTVKVHLKRDTSNNNKMRVTAYIGNTVIVDNQYCWSNPATVSQIYGIYAGHSNSSSTPHTGNFLLDDIRAYPIPSSVQPGITSTVYEVSDSEIHGISQSTSVSAFNSNVTITNSTDSTIYQSDGTTVRTGNIQTGDRLVMNPGSKTYKLYLQNDIYYEDFNAAYTSGTTVGTGWKAIAKPADSDTVSYDTAPAVADNAGVDRAMMSKALDTTKLQLNMYKSVTDNVTVDMDFRLEGKATAIDNGNIRYLLINGTTEAQTTTFMFALSSGSAFDTNYYIRPIYYKSSGSLGNEGSLLDYKKWNHARYEVNLQTDTATLYVNDKVVVENVPFYAQNKFNNITNLQIFNNSSTVEGNIIVDNIVVKKLIPVPKPQSDKYTVDLTGLNISNIPKGTTVDQFKTNITLTVPEATYTLVDEYGDLKTTGYIKMGDQIVVGETKYKLVLNGVLTYANFNDGTFPSGWNGASYPEKYSITDDSYAKLLNDKNKAVYGYQTSLGSRLVYSTGGLSGDFEVMVDFNIPTETAAQLKLCEFVNESNQAIINLSAANGDVVVTYTNSTAYINRMSMEYNAGLWNTLKVVASTNTDTFSVWLNGNLIGKDFPFMGPDAEPYTPYSANSFSQIRFFRNSSTDGDPNFYIDNFMISKADVALRTENLSGNYVSKLSDITDGKINLVANINNSGFNDSGDFVLIIAAYKNNQLVALKQQGFDINVGEENRIELTGFDISGKDVDTVVGYIWNTLNEMKPFADIVKLQ